jgi:hypothetical protein
MIYTCKGRLRYAHKTSQRRKESLMISHWQDEVYMGKMLQVLARGIR